MSLAIDLEDVQVLRPAAHLRIYAPAKHDARCAWYTVHEVYTLPVIWML